MVPILYLVSLLSMFSFACASAGEVKKAGDGAVEETTLNSRSLGDFKVYRGKAPSALVLFISDDDGWTEKQSLLARSLANETTAVATVSLPKLRAHLEGSKAKCAYPAGDLENLSKLVQTELGFADYGAPVLVGSGAGAALAHGAFAQAPENTFSSLIALHFCPRYKLAKAICAGSGFKSKPKDGGAHEIIPPSRAFLNWTAISEPGGKNCSDESAKKAMQAASGPNRFISTDAVADELRSIVAAATGKSTSLRPGEVESLSDLPIILVEPQGEKAKLPSDYFVVLYSGDGGWAGFDKDIARELNERGIPVVGLSTLSYYWKAKSPEVSTKDLDRILETFKRKYGKQKVLLIGYSFGADVLPAMMSLLPEEKRKAILLLSLLSPSGTADFEFQIKHWLNKSSGQPVLPDVQKLNGVLKVQCLWGSDEKTPFCEKIDKSFHSVVKMKGGHRFDGDIKHLIDVIQKDLPAGRPAINP